MSIYKKSTFAIGGATGIRVQIYELQIHCNSQLYYSPLYCAGNQDRTDIADLEGRSNNHYTIPAIFVGEVGNDPTISNL